MFLPHCVEHPVLAEGRDVDSFGTKFHRDGQLLELLFVKGNCLLGSLSLDVRVKSARRRQNLQGQFQHKANEIPGRTCTKDNQKAQHKNPQTFNTARLQRYEQNTQDWWQLVRELIPLRFCPNKNAHQSISTHVVERKIPILPRIFHFL